VGKSGRGDVEQQEGFPLSVIDRIVPEPLRRQEPERGRARVQVCASLAAALVLLGLGAWALARGSVVLGVASGLLGLVALCLPIMLQIGARLYWEPLVTRAEEASRVAESEAARRRRGEARFRSLIEHSEDGISIVAADLGVQYESPSALRLRGLPPGVRPAQTGFRVMHRDDHATAREGLERCFATPGVPISFRVRVRHADGSWRIQEGTGLNLLDDPAVEGIVFNFRDVTDRERAAEEQSKLEQGLRESQRLESLGVMAGGIAHDFNNLLVGIQGNVGLALQDSGLSPRLRSLLEDARQAGERAAGLTRQLLAYAGKGSFSREVLDLSELTREALQLVKASLGERASLDAAWPEEQPWVEADATQIHQVAINLLSNAAEALPDTGGTIRVRTGVAEVNEDYLLECRPRAGMRPGEYAFLEVADDGSGMDASTLERIFDPFFTTKATGRGLGLAATTGILRRHGGSLHVQSRPGAGTVFRILLPRRHPGRIPEAQVRSEDQAKGTGRVLVVDDEEIVRRVIARTLEGRGYQIFLASNGDDAIRHATQDGPFVGVVLDLSMPGMSGAETLTSLRRRDPRLPVLLTSGYSETEADRLQEGENVAFLAKPFEPRALADTLRKLLEGS
jgi:PAS domain S-box-containing protein